MHKLLCAPRHRVEFPTIWLTLLDNYKVNSNCIANRHLAAPTLRGTEKNDINHGFSRINTDRPERKKSKSDSCPSVKIRGGNKPIAMAMKGRPKKHYFEGL